MSREILNLKKMDCCYKKPPLMGRKYLSLAGDPPYGRCSVLFGCNNNLGRVEGFVKGGWKLTDIKKIANKFKCPAVAKARLPAGRAMAGKAKSKLQIKSQPSLKLRPAGKVQMTKKPVFALPGIDHISNKQVDYTQILSFSSSFSVKKEISRHVKYMNLGRRLVCSIGGLGGDVCVLQGDEVLEALKNDLRTVTPPDKSRRIRRPRRSYGNYCKDIYRNVKGKIND